MARLKAVADKEIVSPKKHGVYELVPASSVPAGQKVVGSRWVNKIKADDLFKSRLIVLDGRRYLGSTVAAPSHPSVDWKAFT